MSISSTARQNRRLKLKQLPPVLPTKNSKLLTLSSLALSSNEIPNQNSNLYQQNCGDVNNEVSVNKSIDDVSQSNCSTTAMYDVQSHPIQKVFIEGEREFKVIDASEIFHISNVELSQSCESKTSHAIHAASRTSNNFHSFSNFCHGLLGGISLLYTLILLQFLSPVDVNEENLKYYSFLCQPVQNIFNCLFMICCISVFDRFNIANPNQMFKLIKNFDPRLLVLLVYPVCFLLNLSIGSVDEKFTIFQQNFTAWESLNFEKEEQEFLYWKVINILKCIGGFIGWIIISLSPNFNLFQKHLNDISHVKAAS